MKTKLRIIMVLGIMTIAMVTAGVPLVRHGQYENQASETLCYSELEVEFLMEANHCRRDQAVELLKLSCNYAITTK